MPEELTCESRLWQLPSCARLDRRGRLSLHDQNLNYL